MGDRSAAFFAGKTPKITPITDETPRASATEVKSIYAGKNLCTNATMITANNKPIDPPIKDKMTDSTKN